MNFKQKVYQKFKQVVTDKIDRLQKQLAELKESTANETKSTAGDKYETTRALLQTEQDTVRKKIQEARDQEVSYHQIDNTITSPVIRPGSLVKTSNGWFFISVALGKIIVDGKTVTAISPLSPLGQSLIGLTTNTAIEIKGIYYLIEIIE
jgi:transcription elongation GreA/GreB family factor